MRLVEQFLAWLAALIAPQLAAVDTEPARAAACVAFAAATMERDTGPAPGPVPPPEPDDGECCTECGGTGWVIQPDGHRTPCPCPDDCECKRRGQAGCQWCGGLGAVVVSSETGEEVQRCPCSKPCCQ